MEEAVSTGAVTAYISRRTEADEKDTSVKTADADPDKQKKEEVSSVLEETAPIQAEIPSDASTPAAEILQQDTAMLWKAVYERVKPSLPPDITAFLRIPPKLVPEGETLWIEMEKGLGYNRLNRSELLEKFSQSASEVLGRPVHTQMRENKKEIKEKQDLDYFKQFPEVRFK